MFRALALAFAFTALAVPQARADDEAFTLKLYKSKTGDKYEVEKVDDGKGELTFDLMGVSRAQKVATGKKEVYTEEVLAKKEGDRKATKLKRVYATAEKTEMGKTTKAVYDGETVLIEKKGDKYEFSIDGKVLTEDEAPDLFKSFNREKDIPADQELLPTDPVKVGGTWKVPVGTAEKMFASLSEDKLKVDAKKSTITGKLVKVYKKGDARFGVIEVTVSVVVTEIDLGGQFAAVKEGGKNVLTATIDACIDGSTPGESNKFTLVQELVAELPNNGSLTISGKTTGTATEKSVKK